jgi:hypothetical protein
MDVKGGCSPQNNLENCGSGNRASDRPQQNSLGSYGKEHA